MKDQDRTNFRITPGGIFQCKNDPGWTVIYANDGLFQFLEYTREEFRELFDNQLACVIYPEDLEPLCRTASEQLKKGNVVENENRLVCKSGEVKWIWISCEFVTREGEEPYFYCMFHDITRQKQAQSRMEISERRYDLILSMTPVSYTHLFSNAIAEKEEQKIRNRKSGTENQGRRTGFLPQRDVYPPGDEKENPDYAAKNVIKLAKDQIFLQSEFPCDNIPI